MTRPLLALAAGLALAPPAPADEPTYTKDVQPILKQYCTDCHRSKRFKGGVKLDTFEALMSTGKRPNVVPGDPPRGRLVETMTGPNKTMPPPNWDQPTAAEVEVIRAWVRAGAKK